MGTEQLNRKLAAILYADVAGYSRLTGADEEGTHRALRASLDLITASVTSHNGKVTHYAGDAVLADFATVSDALSCAVDTQRELKSRNDDVPEDRKVQFRIGVNLGEVIVDREEIYGDGVNIAARLESLAAPGGVCISGTVYDAIGTKLPLDYEFLGEQQVKNIDKPVRAYRVLLDPGVKVDRPRVARKSKQVIAATVAGLVALAIAGVLTWFKPWQAREEPASVERMAFPLPGKPSIAVLPFSNLSADPSQEYFSDGLTENIITTLSKIPDMFVIARNSTFTYKGRSVKAKQVAEELGIRYVLEGSFQRAGDRIRVHAQLVDALSGRHLWAERFDRTWTDIFVLQDDLTEKITSALSVKLTDEERTQLARRYTNNVEAYDYFLRGQALYFRFSREDNERAREMYQRAIDLDPSFARAHGALAVSHAHDSRLNWSSDTAVSLGRAFELARKAAAMDDTLPQIQMVLGQIYLFKRRYEDAIGAAQRAISLDSNYADAHALLAVTYTYTGRAEMGLQAMEKAMRLSPHPPALYHMILGRALYFAGQFEKASHALQRAVELNPSYLPSHVFLAATHGKLGNRGDAEWQKAQILGLDPDFSIQRWIARELISENTYRDHLIDGLRKAGIPEKPPLALPDKPSIAVLPFANISGDPEQEYFVDGMTDDLITDLSKISGLLIIASNSSFAYKGKSPDVRQVARELNVKYVLEGSVRRAGDRLRINAQLIDATTGGHLWAERYDGLLGNVFALQDEVTGRIVTALAVELTDAEQERFARKETANPAAYDAFLRGWQHYRRTTPDHYAKAIEYFKRSVELDATYGRAYAALSSTYFKSWREGWHASLGLNGYDVWKQTKGYLELAMQAPTALAHQVAAELNVYRGRHEEAIVAAERAVSADPNDAGAYAVLAFALALGGKPVEAMDAIRSGRRLDPYSETHYSFLQGIAEFGMEQYQAAASSFEKSIELNPELWSRSSGCGCNPLAPLLAVYGHLAREHDIQELRHNLFGDTGVRVRTVLNWWPFSKTEDAERLAEGLRKAGLPE